MLMQTTDLHMVVASVITFYPEDILNAVKVSVARL